MTIFDKMGKFICDFVSKNHRLPTMQEYNDNKMKVDTTQDQESDIEGIDYQVKQNFSPNGKKLISGDYQVNLNFPPNGEKLISGDDNFSANDKSINL